MKKTRHISLEVDLYQKIKILAAKQDKRINEMIEEGIRLVLEKYDENEKKPNS